MSTIAVIGAGTLGGTIAHTLACRDRFRAVHLVDPDGSIAAGKALDISQGAAVERFRCRVTGHRSNGVEVDAPIVVLAGPASEPDREWDLEEGSEIVRQLSIANPHVVVICAGVTHRHLIECLAAEGMSRHQVIGAAPYALESGIRAIVGVELRCSPTQVSLVVLGRPPEHTVIPWTTVTVRGFDIAARLEPTRLARLQARAHQVWPPGPYALASATARVCEAVAGGSRLRSMSCYVVLDGELGARRRAVAVQVELGPGGVSRVLEPSLSVRERQLLESAVQT